MLGDVNWDPEEVLKTTNLDIYMHICNMGCINISIAENG